MPDRGDMRDKSDLVSFIVHVWTKPDEGDKMLNFDVKGFWDEANKRLDAVISEFPLEFDVLDNYPEEDEEDEEDFSDEWYEEDERWQPYQNGQIV